MGRGVVRAVWLRFPIAKLTGHAAELSEFFLMLTEFGNPVFRRCRRKWVRGAQIGVSFKRTDIGIKSSKEVPQEQSGV